MVQPRIKGFTLIELIIGITILALLAVGLLAALDPAEQFAKARDTSTRNTLLELYGALQRYEAAQEDYPAGVDAAKNNTGMALRDDDGTTYNFTDAVGDLITAGELKANFKNAAGTAQERIYLFKDIGGGAGLTDGKIMLCFRPTSKSFQLQAGLYTAADDVGSVQPWPAAALAAAPDQTGACATGTSSLTGREPCVYCAQ